MSCTDSPGAARPSLQIIIIIVKIQFRQERLDRASKCTKQAQILKSFECWGISPVNVPGHWFVRFWALWVDFRKCVSSMLRNLFIKCTKTLTFEIVSSSTPLMAKWTDQLAGGGLSPAPSLWIENPFTPHPRSSRITQSWILHTSSTPLLPHLTGEMCERREDLGFRV